MKLGVIYLIVAMMFGLTAPSWSQTPSPSPIPAVSPTPTPAVTTVVPADTAPPQWVQDVLVNSEALPVVGPVITKVLMYTGILATILTSLVAFLLAAIGSLSGIASMTGLTAFAAQLQAFKNGKIMYWITYLSMFNAQKPTAPTTIKVG